MLVFLEWLATLSGITAAIMVSANLGQKPTGIGFTVFTLSSISWICVGVIQGELPLTLQNVVLTLVNVFGIYRWLILKPQRKKDAPA
ncbi:hypothetical protein [Woodsholea maritima]|uniref:hypothetical protein n=1 Tax=Woodsholea maritima TaxID=240237 RepID=UPI00035E8972|nr:hypothetical protein [Woodsholea maritima]